MHRRSPPPVSDPPTFPLSLVLQPLQARAAPTLFTPALTRPYPTYSNNTAKHGPSPEDGGTESTRQGYAGTCSAQTLLKAPEIRLWTRQRSLPSHPSREVLGVSDEAQRPGGKTGWGGAAGCQRRGEGAAGAGGTVLSPGLPFP